MYSNVKMAHMINAICVESVTGKGTEQDPSRLIVEYFDMEGELLAQRDNWAENTKEKPVDSMNVIRLLQDSWTLTNYINTRLAKGEIEATEDENAFDIALRLLKTQQARLDEYAGVIKICEESKLWRLENSWTLKDQGFRCDRCGDEAARNEDELCLPCWEKLMGAKHIMEGI